MGLRAQAAIDARAILEDGAGFRWPLVLTSPAGVETNVYGFQTDIAEQVDPETGVIVAARQCFVTISLAALPEMPTAVATRESRPWLVAYPDVTTSEIQTFKVVEVLPDRALGVVRLILEAYAGAD